MCGGRVLASSEAVDDKAGSLKDERKVGQVCREAIAEPLVVKERIRWGT
jgi:hypothetical protein